MSSRGAYGKLNLPNNDDDEVICNIAWVWQRRKVGQNTLENKFNRLPSYKLVAGKL